MNDLESILNTIRRPFALEMKTEYQDKAVIGGLGAYVMNWVEKASENAASNQASLLRNLAELFRDYSEIQSAVREARLQEASKIIDQLYRQMGGTPNDSAAAELKGGTRRKTQDTRQEEEPPSL